VLLLGYTASMALAAAGFFAFTYFLVVHADLDEAPIAGRLRYSLFLGVYAVILVPSALWLPLTSAMIQHLSSVLWLGIRLVHALVGLGSVALLWALLSCGRGSLQQPIGWPGRGVLHPDGGVGPVCLDGLLPSLVPVRSQRRRRRAVRPA
jgi:hypothetical protein